MAYRFIKRRVLSEFQSRKVQRCLRCSHVSPSSSLISAPENYLHVKIRGVGPLVAVGPALRTTTADRFRDHLVALQDHVSTAGKPPFTKSQKLILRFCVPAVSFSELEHSVQLLNSSESRITRVLSHVSCIFFLKLSGLMSVQTSLM